MNHTISIFAVFSVLVGVLLFGIWSNIHAYAQQSSSPTLSASAPRTGGSVSTTISPELKAKMCDPSNPTLKVVNTTESNICGIPKTVKPPSLSAATPSTSAISSSLPPQQTTTTTKPTAVASVAAPRKQQQQQQIATTNNNNSASRPTGGATGATIAPVSNHSNRLLSSSPSPIAPQVKAISQQQQQQQQQQPQPVKAINSTAGQNYTFAAISPVVASGKLLYLGYHGSDGTPTTDGDSSSKDKVDTKPSAHSSSSSSSTSTHSSSKDKDSSDTKPSTDHSKSSTKTDNGSTEKKKTSITRSDRTHSINDDSSSKHKSSSSDTKSSSHNDDDGGSKSSSELASIIIDSFNFKHSTDSDNNDNG
jgi:hypothetical protein